MIHPGGHVLLHFSLPAPAKRLGLKSGRAFFFFSSRKIDRARLDALQLCKTVTITGDEGS